MIIPTVIDSATRGAYDIYSLLLKERIVYLGTAIEENVTNLVVAQLLYFLGATLCVFSTYWSISFIFAVQLYYTTGIRLPVVSGTMIGRS